MTESFTPGPWYDNGDDEAVGGVPFIDISSGDPDDGSFKPIAEVCSTLLEIDEFEITAEDRANAALIAAAPDLYNALRNTLPYIPTEYRDIALFALGKARGET